LIVVMAWDRGGTGGPVTPIPADVAPAIQARAVLLPRVALFGDTVTARVDVTLNRARVDADSVRVSTDFAPWEAIAKPERRRRDGKTTTHLRTTWVLRCFASACLPPRQPLPVPLPAATVTYDALAPQAAAGRKLVARWPLLVVYTRLDPAALNPTSRPGGSPFETPWRADLVSMPPVSYRVEPDTARIPLYAAGGVFAVLGLALAYLGRPRRRPKPVLLPEEPPARVITPLEHALGLLEDPVAADGAADRRRALELVAAELAGRGNHDLARTARRLAWSAQAPQAERTSGLAEQARPALGLDEEEEAAAEQADPDADEEVEPRG
jgi:hypothetical protein